MNLTCYHHLDPLPHFTSPCDLPCCSVLKVFIKIEKGEKNDFWSHYKVIMWKERSGGCYNTDAALWRLRKERRKRSGGGETVSCSHRQATPNLPKPPKITRETKGHGTKVSSGTVQPHEDRLCEKLSSHVTLTQYDLTRLNRNGFNLFS